MISKEKMETAQKRQVARKVRIAEILEGAYVRGEGWEPSYVLTKDGTRLSRLNLMAAIVSIQQGAPSNTFILDDGTGTIGLRPFEEMPSLRSAETGDIINVIGKPREYGGERYVSPEIVRIIRDDGWVKVRQKELELNAEEQNPAQKAPVMHIGIQAPIEEVEVEETIPQQENPFQKIYRLIKKFDSGEGASIEEVLKAAELHNAEQIIGELLKEGEIFEIKSGRLKILE